MKRLNQIVFLVFFVMYPFVSSASFVVAKTVEDMSQESTEIVQGLVESQEFKNEKGRFLTLTHIRVERGWKGRVEAGGVVTVVTPGGTSGKYSQHVPGAPRFQKGSTVLLFLWAAKQSEPYRVYGLSQGVFRIQEEAAGLYAISDRRDLNRLVEETRKPAEDVPEVRLPLSTLYQRILKGLQRLEKGTLDSGGKAP